MKVERFIFFVVVENVMIWFFLRFIIKVIIDFGVCCCSVVDE